MFKRFGKLQDVHKMNNRGVGLGLIICQQLCHCHDGKIWLSSREMEGSVFSFTMKMPPVTKSEDMNEINEASGLGLTSGFGDTELVSEPKIEEEFKLSG